jgi:MoaA/NifB/PqqE/SkfB family radical SAM enzyme
VVRVTATFFAHLSEQVKNRGEKPFKHSWFEVAGVCNSRCTYCVTGAKNASPGGIMQADTFNATLQNLERLNLIDSQSVIELYNWGQVSLHPDLQNIIRVINDHGLRYSISTNGSIVPQIMRLSSRI